MWSCFTNRIMIKVTNGWVTKKVQLLVKRIFFFIIYHTGIQLFQYIGIPQGRPDIIPPFALDDQSFIDLPAFYKTFTWPASKKWWMDYIRDRPLPSITLSEVLNYIYLTQKGNGERFLVG